MARTMIIDRFEGIYAICEGEEDSKGKGKHKKDVRYFAIEQTELPEGAKEGDILVIRDDGTLAIDEAATKARREKIKKLQNNLWAD